MTSSADGPDQGDPAAPVLWGVEGITAAHPPVIRTVLTTLEEASQVAQRLGGTVVPLYRAPGAVAAAPPGDGRLVEAEAVLRRHLTGAYGHPSLVAMLDRLVAAPPAGHEDETAVERADEYAALQMSATTARARGDYDAERQALDRLHLLDLAAARGPRTPGSES